MTAEWQRSVDRSGWAVEVRTLNTQEGARMGGSPASRLRALHELSVLGWRLTGNPMPDYARSATPIRLSRLEPAAQT